MKKDEGQGSHRKIPLFDKIGYGVGNFSTGVAMQVIGAYLVFYCTAILDIPGSLVGIAVSISIIWDGITDPLMGYFSDITKSKRFGRRHLYILIGSIGMAVTNLFLWNISREFSTYSKFLIVLVVMLAIKTFMTIYITPYTALGAEMSKDYNERTSIQGIKTVFFLLGLGFVSVVGMYFFFKPTAEFPIGQLSPHAYRNMGYFTSAIIVVFGIMSFLLTKKYIPILNDSIIETENGKLKNLLSSFKGVLVNKTFIYIALSYMFINISSAFLSNIGLHVFTYTFNLSSGQIAYIVGAQFIVSILSQPIWMYASRKIDKKNSILLGLTLSIIASLIFIPMVFLRNMISGNTAYFMPFAILAGFGTGGLFTLPLSMVADVTDVDELETGKRSEGTYFGCLTLFYKLSQSITLFLIGMLLDVVKFDSSLLVQSENTVLILGLTLAIGPTISLLFAAWSIVPYKLNRSKLEAIQMRIKEKGIAEI